MPYTPAPDRGELAADDDDEEEEEELRASVVVVVAFDGETSPPPPPMALGAKSGGGGGRPLPTLLVLPPSEEFRGVGTEKMEGVEVANKCSICEASFDEVASARGSVKFIIMDEELESPRCVNTERDLGELPEPISRLLNLRSVEDGPRRCVPPPGDDVIGIGAVVWSVVVVLAVPPSAGVFEDDEEEEDDEPEGLEDEDEDFFPMNLEANQDCDMIYNG